MPIPLTPQQHALFFRLAQLDHDGSLFGKIIPIPISASQYVIYLSGTENMRIRQLSDLDALAEIGLLEYELSRMGTTKHYNVSSEGRKVFGSGEFKGEPFTRLGLVLDEARLLKMLLVDLLEGDVLSMVLTEIGFVHNLLDARSPDPRIVRKTFQKILRTLDPVWDDGDLAKLTQTMAVFGKWTRAINDLLG